MKILQRNKNDRINVSISKYFINTRHEITNSTYYSEQTSVQLDFKKILREVELNTSPGNARKKYYEQMKSGKGNQNVK